MKNEYPLLNHFKNFIGYLLLYYVVKHFAIPGFDKGYINKNDYYHHYYYYHPAWSSLYFHLNLRNYISLTFKTI